MHFNQYHATNGRTIDSDSVFGPIVTTPCRQGLDFTLMFEQSILSVLPSVLLLLFAPMRLYSLYRSPVKTLPTSMHGVKAMTAIIFASLQLVLLVVWSKEPVRTQFSLASAALLFLDSLAILQLSYVEHDRSIRPSALLNVYLFISSVFDVTQARTLYSLFDNSLIPAVFSAGICLKLALLILEAQSKRRYLKYPYRDFSLEATSGIINKSFFWWLNSLFIRGFRNVLTIEDLPLLDNDLLSEPLRDRIQSQWDDRTKPEGRFALLLAISGCLRWPFVSIIFPRVCLIGFSFSQPFLISRIITFVSEPTTTRSDNIGYGLIAAAVFIYSGIAISTVHYKHRLYRAITILRGSLVGLIYNRTLSLQDGVYDESAAVTLMSTDVDRIALSMQDSPDIWAQLIEVSLGIWLLARQLGWVCVITLVVVLICALGSKSVATRIGGRQKVWSAEIQKRIAMTSSLLASMKEVKMMGLIDLMSTRIQGQRIRELRVARGFRWLILSINVIASIPATYAPVATFLAFAIQAKLSGSNSLSTNKVFTSLAIIFLVTKPAVQLLGAVSFIASATGSLDRIQKFLVAPSWDDTRRVLGNAPASLKGVNSNGMEGIDFQDIQSSMMRPSDTIAIEVAQATVRPSPSFESALVDVTLQVKRASITIVVGPIGSGKSTLMKAILGELPCDSGHISVSSRRMAFCAQTPWMLNTTIEQSICGLSFGSDVDEEWYRTVLHACALEEDMLQLPQGDQSVIGSRGLTLSGGQKQRLALARTVYARRDIVLLDDVLSALDGKTERIVVNRLFGFQGLFRRFETTVVLITHTTRHFRLADRIVVLGTDKTIAQQGTYNELESQPGFVSSTLRQPYDVLDEVNHLLDVPKNEAVNSLVEDDLMDLTRKTGDMTVYRYYLRSIGWPNAFGFLGSVAAFAFTMNFPQVWLNWWTEDASGNAGKYITVYVALAICSSAFSALTLWWVLIRIGPKASAQLHLTLLQTVMRAPQSFFAATDTGVTLNRFSQDMNLIDRVLPFSALMVTSQFFTCIAKAALISTGSTFMAISIPFCVIAVYFLQKAYLRTSRQLRFMDLEAKSPLYTHFLESLEGLSTIRAFGWQERSKATNIKRLDESQRPYYLMYCIQRWLNLVLDLIVVALAVIVITLAVKLRSTTSSGLIGIALNNILGFNQALSFLVDYWTQLETSLGAVARVKTFESSTDPESKAGEDFVPPDLWPEKGVIEFCNVTAAYGPAALALHDISMSISPGQKIGICGRTGSGKSSLLLTLLRLLDIESGTITIDGLDLQTLPRELIRSRMTAIPQDPFILSENVRLNADPSGTVSDDSVISSLKKIHLWPAIEARGGLDAQMKEQPLSQGQHQLFCLARAMLRKSKILILDEATSNVDVDTDRLMQRIIREEFRDHTIITVAHRLDTILDADVVAVLDAGRLVEFDSPQELLGRASLFRDLNGANKSALGQAVK